ncbi:MAG: metallopeptidase family protein [Patescibacteria group bacterium]|nr:metallopeptidase family protein [Patescibacteria group bacterium]
MTLETFETIVAEEAAKIPEKFLKKLKNVAFVVEERPSDELLEEMDVPEGETILGIFDGVSLGEQGSGPWEMPGRIVVFKKPSEDEAADTGMSVHEVVYDTLWHEVAHYFGMDEHEVMHAEKKKKMEKSKREE